MHFERAFSMGKIFLKPSRPQLRNQPFKFSPNSSYSNFVVSILTGMNCPPIFQDKKCLGVNDTFKALRLMSEWPVNKQTLRACEN